MSTLKAINENSALTTFASACGPRSGRTHTPVQPPTPGRDDVARRMFESAASGGIADNDCLRVEVLDSGRTLSCLILTDLGMYVRAEERIADATVLRLRLALPRSVETIEVTGEVTSVSLCAAAFGNEAGFGILFQDLSEEGLRRIRNYIDWNQVEKDVWEPDAKEFAVLDPWVSAFESSNDSSAGLRAESFLMRFPVTPEMEEALRVAACC